jgi:nucleoside-diphosphate-sugar epimerase
MAQPSRARSHPGPALVTGAYGIVGLNVVEELQAAGGWSITAVGRRPRPPLPQIGYVSVDLAQPEAARAALAGCGDVRHLFFGAYQYNADPHEEVAINVAMLAHTLDGLQAAGAKLERVVIYQGSKAYGALQGPMKTPAKESDPRVPGPLFYYDQEDLLYERGAREGFATTVLRPDFIVGVGFGSYTNLLNVVAVYATVCRVLGLPLYFPGGPSGYRALFQMTDARLLARASIWAALEGGRENAIYNVTNGDLFRWENVWGRVADYFGVKPAHPMRIDLRLFMKDKAPLWRELAAKHDLVVPFEQFLDWNHSGILGLSGDIHTSTIKIRQAGFQECLDSEDRLFELFDEMKARRFIPDL